MRIVALVPAKLNSERIPNKNIQILGDKPLCQYIFDALKPLDIDIYCMCSDERIVDFLPDWVEYLNRPEHLDTPEATPRNIVDYFSEVVDYDILVNCHITAPFLKSSSIERGMLKVVSGEYDSALSVKRHQSFFWRGGIPFYDTKNIPRTQDLEVFYEETGGVYVFSRETFFSTGSRVGNKPYFIEVNYIEDIDIDWPEDLEFARKIQSCLS